MKILLVNPPSPPGTEYVRLERCMQKKSAWAGSLWPPLPLMYAQSILEKNGFETKLKDATAENMGYEETINFVVEEKPDFLVINTSVPTIHFDGKLAMQLKKRLKKLKTIAIGFPCCLLPDIVARYGFDFAIIGDVEYSILDIVQGKNNFKKRKNRTKFYESQVENLDSLPFPSLRDLKLDKYSVPFTKEKLMLVEPGRGCPFQCIFCLVPVARNKVSYRSAKSFVDELERDYKEYGIKNFLFWTENATLNRKLMNEICDEILKRRLKIKWMTPSRADTVSYELLKKMKAAGCWMLSLGIESLDQNVLDLVKKNIRVEKIEEAVKMIKKVGIKIMAHIIIGLPGQTKESFDKTLEWLIKKDIDYCQFYCAVPYWKTELRRIADKNGWIKSNDPAKYEIDKSVMSNEFLSPKEIEDMRKKAFIKFYFRPKFIFKEMVIYKFNPLFLINLVADGMYFLKYWIIG